MFVSVSSIEIPSIAFQSPVYFDFVDTTFLKTIMAVRNVQTDDHRTLKKKPPQNTINIYRTPRFKNVALCFCKNTWGLTATVKGGTHSHLVVRHKTALSFAPGKLYCALMK